MKYIQSLSVVILFFAISVSCTKEIPPKITPCQTNRVVLVEEFTGVSCVNCPAGADKLNLMSEQLPGKMVIVGIHAGYFATPSSSNTNLDLRCADGQSIESQLLGPVSSYPSASINRKIFTGENQFVIDLSKWAGYINAEICNRSAAELNLNTSYNSADSILNVEVEITPNSYFDEPISDDIALTIMITEDDILGYQMMPTGADSNYVHKHVLRDIITEDYSGDVLFNRGNIISSKLKSYGGYKIPSGWNPASCHVVAFIHYKGENNIEILQAVEKALN